MYTWPSLAVAFLTSVDAYIVRKLGHYSGCNSQSFGHCVFLLFYVSFFFLEQFTA